MRAAATMGRLARGASEVLRGDIERDGEGHASSGSDAAAGLPVARLASLIIVFSLAYGR
jgi:hypothetical protein